MAELVMVGGLVVLFDDADQALVAPFTWSPHRPSKTDSVYAKHDAIVGGNRHSVSMHRLLLGLSRGDGLLVDHRNGNTLDNRRNNLRVATARQNAQNITRSPNQKRGGYKGVHLTRFGMWCAQIRGGALRADGRRAKICLGNFSVAEEAARAYDAKAQELFGQFASLNFPEGDSNG